ETADEMPGEELLWRICDEEVRREFFAEVERGRRIFRHEKLSQIAAEKLRSVSRIDGALVHLPECIVQREIEHGETNERREQRHRLGSADILSASRRRLSSRGQNVRAPIACVESL